MVALVNLFFFLQVQESIILSLVVGLSIDYTVHLAEAYSRSDEKLRKRRLHDTLQTVGVSVFSGFLTSMGSAICLVPCQLVPLSRFGILMCTVIGLSFLYAMLFFLIVILPFYIAYFTVINVAFGKFQIDHRLVGVRIYVPCCDTITIS